MMLREAFDDLDTSFATTHVGFGERSGLKSVHLIPDCNRNRPIATLWCILKVASLLIQLRPDIVISTGALPGLIAVAIGKQLRARTIWVDSIANAEEMSFAGRKAKYHSDLWLSQWPAVAASHGANYLGSVL